MSRFWRGGGKRAADVALTLALAPLWVPLTGALAALVAVTTGRPAFFTQQRVGRGGRTFTIWKLRTMRPGAPPAPGGRFEHWTYSGDPRVTPVGRWLRRYRLDELPQLAQVLTGEMSLVGPRPETPEVIDGLAARIPGYRRRLEVTPGLTGLCQVSDAYERFATWDEISRKLELDLNYIERLSLRTDAAILLRTARVLARGSGVQ